jgi:murein L,D-transpeptidase YafK
MKRPLEQAAEPGGRLLSPRIVVKKAERALMLYDGLKLIAAFPAGLGFNPEGPKQKEGDGATPEGEYYVCMRNAASKFHRSLGLSYPNAKDAASGLQKGAIGEEAYRSIVKCMEEKRCPPWDTPLGGEICIHGHGSGSDWTAGCIALENADMDVLFELCPLGTGVVILP